MRKLGLLALLVAALTLSSGSAARTVPVSTTGVRLSLPAGWHARALDPRLSTCDPVTLVVANSESIRLEHGHWAAPARGQMLMLLLEDHVNKPEGDLRRPARFHVRWNRLTQLSACCQLPALPASMRYFREHGRHLGFIVFPGHHVSAATRRTTERLLDSLRVS